MEAKKEAISSSSSSSSSSYVASLLGPKEPSSSSLSDSMFPTPPKDHGKDYIGSEETKKNCDSTIKRDVLEKNEDKIQAPMIDFSPYYEKETSQPCTLSSSLHYGGQDIIAPRTRTTDNTPAPERPTKYDVDLEADPRGNWWMGSLYY